MAYKEKILTYRDAMADEITYPPKRAWSDNIREKTISPDKCLTFQELNDNYLMGTESYNDSKYRLVFEKQFPTPAIKSYQLKVVFKERSTLPSYPTRFKMDGYLGTVNYGGNSGIKDVEWKYQYYSSPVIIENYFFDPMYVKEDGGDFIFRASDVSLEITAYYELNEEITFSYHNNNIANNSNTYLFGIWNNQCTITCNPSETIIPSPSEGASLRVNFVNGNNIDVTYPFFREVECSDNPLFTDGSVEKIRIIATESSIPPNGQIAFFETRIYPVGTIIYIRSTDTNNRLNFGLCYITSLSSTSINLIAVNSNRDYIAFRLTTNGINEYDKNLTLENIIT